MNNQNKSHRLRNWLITIIAIIAVAFLAFWPTDYYIESPGEAVPVGQFIKSPNKKPNNFYLVTVSILAGRLRFCNICGVITRPHNDRVPSKELLGGQTSAQYNELQNWYMETSQQKCNILCG